MWDYTGMKVFGEYMNEFPVTGRVESSRVAYGGDVKHTDGPAVRLSQISLSLAIEGKGDAVAQLRFGGPEVELEASTELEPLRCLARLRPRRG